jgi:predicted O-methyltransferase YrrM
MTRGDQVPDRIHYIQTLFAQEDEALASVSSVLEESARRMQLDPEEGKTIHLLTKMAGIKTAVEVGVLAGYSAVWIARALPDDGMLYAIEKDDRRIEGIQKNLKACGVDHKVTVLCGDAHVVLKDLSAKGPFDMMFIDADKGGYPDYLTWAEDNIRTGGVIIGDNTFLFDTVYKNSPPEGWSKKNWEGMQSFNTRLADAEKYTSIMLSTEAGMTIALKK